ncbi:MAG: hypothetical protein JNN30_03235 [Rhodanobacteraceae bacterium]|nr:hypothetical protein [Rhodanobacteraceae bacterium]
MSTPVRSKVYLFLTVLRSQAIEGLQCLVTGVLKFVIALFLGAAPAVHADTYHCQAELRDHYGTPVAGQQVLLRALKEDAQGRPRIEVGRTVGTTGASGTLRLTLSVDDGVSMLRCSAANANPELRDKFRRALGVLHEPGDNLPAEAEVMLVPDIAPDANLTVPFEGLKDEDGVAQARLYQSGDYDRVIVMPEPFNRREQDPDFGRRTQYDLWRKFEVLMPTLHELGYDVWIVQARLAGENIHEQAAAFAQALAYAARHDGGPDGGKVVGAGFSLAGPVLRIATARWQSDAAWRLALGLPDMVPASLLIFGDAPLRGAQVNVDIQKLLWERGEQGQMNLNSCTAQQLIRSGLASEGAMPGTNEWRFRQLGSEISFKGPGTCDYGSGGLCYCERGPAVESLGPNHNGWATGIRKIAFSHGTWNSTSIQCYGDDRDKDTSGVDLCPRDPGGSGPWVPNIGSVIARLEIDSGSPIPVCWLGNRDFVASAGDLEAGSRHDGLLDRTDRFDPSEVDGAWHRLGAILGGCDTARITQRFAPSFIPIRSALDTDTPFSNGPFDATRTADHHSFHEKVPGEILDWLLTELAQATGGTPPGGGGGGSSVRPAAPSSLTAVPVRFKTNQVELKFQDNSFNEQGFVIYRMRAGEGIWRPVADLDSDVTRFVDEVPVLPDPANTTTYYFYKVQAYNTAGSSAWSNRTEARLYNIEPLRPITDAPDGCADSLRPRLHWFGAKYASSFYVHVADDETGEDLYDNQNHLGNELVLPQALVAGRRYSYIVQGQNNVGRSPWSERRYFIPQCTPLTAPVLEAPRGCVDSVRPTLNWAAVPNAAGYTVKLREVSTVPGVDDRWVYPPNALPWTTDDQFPLSIDLVPGREYWYQVKAGDGVNTGPWSGIRYFSVQCPANPLPGIASPISPYGQVLTSTPTYRWETGHHASSYRLTVRRRPEDQLVFENIYVAAAACNATDCEVTPSQSLPAGSYYFEVQSMNAAGNAPPGPSSSFAVPALPTLSVTDVNVTEGDGATVDANVVVTLAAAAPHPVRLRLRTVDDSAHAPADYTARDENITIAPGVLSYRFTVRVHGDTVHEGTQRLRVLLSNLQGAGSSDTEAFVTIRDDDPAPTVRADDMLLTEPTQGNHAVHAFNVQLAGATELPVDVPYTVQACTATAGSDYTANPSGMLRFDPGISSRSVPFQLLGDNTLEGDELFTLALGTPNAATLIKDYANATVLEHQGPVLGLLRADFDVDGHNDLVWHDPTVNQYGIWSLRGPQRMATTTFDPPAPADVNWSLAAVADFNRDTQPDLLWRNATSGRLSVWFMNGVKRASAQLFDGRTDATIAGVADFGLGASPDILWRANDRVGSLSVWFMDGTSLVSNQALVPSAPADANWSLQVLADYDADGEVDLLWRNTSSGALVAWLMDGITRGDLGFRAICGDLGRHSSRLVKTSPEPVQSSCRFPPPFELFAQAPSRPAAGDPAFPTGRGRPCRSPFALGRRRPDLPG